MNCFYPLLNEGGELSLNSSYEKLIRYAKDNHIPLKISFETFKNGYLSGNYESVDQYLSSYYSLLKPEVDETTSRHEFAIPKWYYNTGLTLPRKPNYSKYKLLSNVKVGDVIFEANGGFGITGHIAIVEGEFYDKKLGVNYIRVIEAIADGVVRSVLDDERIVDKDVAVLRAQKHQAITQNAVDFCISQLGKSYCLDLCKDTSKNEKDWYCSELVWAAYYNSGLNLETSSTYNEPGISPRDLKSSYSLSVVDILHEDKKNRLLPMYLLFVAIVFMIRRCMKKGKKY